MKEILIYIGFIISVGFTFFGVVKILNRKNPRLISKKTSSLGFDFSASSAADESQFEKQAITSIRNDGVTLIVIGVIILAITNWLEH